MENSSKKQLPAFLVLALIAVVAALVLGLTNEVTKGPIEEHRMAALNAAYGAVMPAAKYEKMDVAQDGVSGLYQAVDENGDVVGYCVTASAKGYGGDVAVTLGVDAQGVVRGCVVGDNNFAETDGFGKRAQEPAFQEQFEGISAVDGGTFMPLSGATVTSKAVLNATNAALKCVAETALGQAPEGDLVAFGEKAAPTMDLSAIQPGATLRGTAEGYGGAEITATIKLDSDCKIASVKLDVSSQTPGFGQRCDDAAFTDQFVGKALPLEEIDILSGATITSNAVKDAINGSEPCEDEGANVTPLTEKDGVAIGVDESGAAVITAAGNSTVTLTLSVEDGKVVGAEVASVEAAAAALPEANENGEYAVSAQGFQSKVGVTVTLDENGAIATIKVNSANETEYFGTRCGEDKAFAEQFVGKKGPFTIGENCDALSGATVTSTAVVTALNELFPAEAAAAPAAALPEANENGEYAVSAQGFQSKVGVTVTLDENGAIATIKVNSANETEYFGTRCGEDKAFAEQFVGKKGPFTIGENCDALSGATITSTAVVKALNELFPAEAAAAPAAALPEANENGEYAVSAQGFQSKVGVTVTLDENGAIATIKVNSANETEYFGTRCGEDKAFAEQFVGKKGPFTIGENCDALSGATITSTAVVKALNELFPAEAAAAPAATKVEPNEKGEYSVSAQGFQSKVGVTVTLDESGAIATIKVNSANETEYFGTRCGEDKAFAEQFVGKKAPFTIGENCDALSGATITSTAVVTALNQLAD